MTDSKLRALELVRPPLLALLFAACGGSDVPSDSTLGELYEVELGVEAVQVVGVPDGVTRVVDVQPTADGRVWVLNSTAPLFTVLDGDGSQRAFGERGGGPEEFDAAWALAPGGVPDEVWVLDVVRSTMVRVWPAPRVEIRLDPGSTPPSSLISFQGAGINQAPPWVERVEGGWMLARDRSGLRETALQTWSADLVRLGEDGALSPYAPVAEMVGDPGERYGDAAAILPYPLWTVCEDGSVGLYSPLTNSARRVSPAGEELSGHELPTDRAVPITADRIFEMFYRQMQAGRPAGQLPPMEQARQLTQEQNDELARTSASSFPEYARMACTAGGVLWLQEFDWRGTPLGQGNRWIRIAEDGSLTRFSMPEGFTVFRVAEDRGWGTLRDSLGVESVGWIPWNEVPR
jgi:hypothetical protein